MEPNYKYKSLSDFIKSNKREYYYLNYRGWINQLCEDMGWEPLRPIIHLTYEKCKEEALKYNSIKDWRINSNNTYNCAKRNGWFDELSKNMVRLKTITEWTLEICKEIALKYNTKTEWNKVNTHSVRIAKLNGWYEECTKHMITNKKPPGYWTYEKCKKEALKYKTKKEWKHKGLGSYTTARKNKWVDELSTHMEEYLKPPGYWTLERCLEYALNYQVKEHWKNGHPPSYQGAMAHGHYDECTKHMVQTIKPPNYWTKERCIKEARKYSTKKEWTKKSSGSLNAARINNWMDECSGHIIRTCKKQGYWQIKENCTNEAKKYNTITDWAKASSASYTSSKKNNWYNECTKHMIKTRENKKPSGYWHVKENCIEDAKKYKKKLDWYKNSSSAVTAAKMNGWYEECTKHMTLIKTWKRNK